jgi:hypothetical protein
VLGVFISELAAIARTERLLDELERLNPIVESVACESLPAARTASPPVAALDAAQQVAP